MVYANKMVQNVSFTILKQKLQCELHKAVQVQRISDSEALCLYARGIGSAFSEAATLAKAHFFWSAET